VGITGKNRKEIEKSIDILLESYYSHESAINIMKNCSKKERIKLENAWGDIPFHEQCNKEYKYVINTLIKL